MQLLIDTSNRDLVVGLAENKKIIASVNMPAWQKQSELLVPTIERLLRENNRKKSEINEVAVGNGPGSYTGVRIGLTVAKTIAYANKATLYVNSSLSLLKTPQKSTICVMNARAGRSYFAVYCDEKVIEKDTVLENEKVLEYIKNHPQFVLAGELSQLGLKSAPINVIEQLLNTINDAHKVSNIFAVKPVYLKEL